MRLCVVTRAPTADGQKTGLLQPSPPSPPPGLCVPMLGGSRLYKGGGYWPPWGKWWRLSDLHFKARDRANFETSVQAPGRLEGQPVRWGGLFTAQDILGILSGDAVSHGYGLATVSGERAWLCPQFPPLPEWLHPPPARGHPVSRPWADRAPWGPQSNQGSWAQQGAAPGAGTRRGVPI